MAKTTDSWKSDSGIPSKTPGTGKPESPLELNQGDWKATLKRTLVQVKRDRVTLVAAGMAFYWFLAVFPSLIAAVGIIGLLDLGPQVLSAINASIGLTIPGSAGEILTAAIDGALNASPAATVAAALIGIVLALWGATAGMVALQEGLNIAYEVPVSRSFLGKRAVALVLVVATGILVLLPSLFALRGFLGRVLVWLIMAVTIMILFGIFYSLGPNRERPSWKWVTPGGLVGTAIWIAAGAGFSFYVGNFATYGETYGPMAGVVILLFWLYLSALAIMLGGELNAELERQSALREGRA